MEKDLNYYMSLNYPIEIIKIPEDEGGGYEASIPLLGKNVFLGDGETIEEAIKNLENVKREWFKTYLDRGTPILEPPVDEEEEYSGRFVVRVPKELHRYLSHVAEKNEVSLNQYIQYLLTSSAVTDGFESVMEQCTIRFNQLVEEMRSIEYKIGGAATQYNRSEALKIYFKSDYEKAA